MKIEPQVLESKLNEIFDLIIESRNKANEAVEKILKLKQFVDKEQLAQLDQKI